MLNEAESHEPALPMKFALNREWRVSSWNREAEKYTAFTTQDMLGRDFLSVMTAEWRAPTETALRKAASGETADTRVVFWTRAAERLDMAMVIMAMENNVIHVTASCESAD
eukprot:TRINITY_DN41139_c0_g1_i2.p1 TRINITY_DN41139_c0_g1~~TRINITY_DN41139_c0_g1_i2.p1  ORF type:complete len:111 (-),score=27.49 TRINITY_DN41139_c0_g1_i2:180-512(-)